MGSYGLQYWQTAMYKNCLNHMSCSPTSICYSATTSGFVVSYNTAIRPEFVHYVLEFLDFYPSTVPSSDLGGGNSWPQPSNRSSSAECLQPSVWSSSVAFLSFFAGTSMQFWCLDYQPNIEYLQPSVWFSPAVSPW